MPRLYFWGLLASCVGAIVGFIPAYSIVLRMQAESLIRNASILSEHMGEAFPADNLQAIYGGRLAKRPGCTRVSCQYEGLASNPALAMLHWAPYSELRSEIWFEDGILSTIVLDFTSTANSRHSIVSHVYIQQGKGLEFDLHPWEQSSPGDTNGIVAVRPESLKVHKQTVLGFNTTCLTMHRGCTSVAELLPTVWEQTKEGNIRCRLENHEGFIESPW